MNFIIALLKTKKKFDTVWMIVDQLTRSTRFIPIKTICTLERLAKLYIREIVSLHGIIASIVFNKDTGLVGRF